MQNRWHNKKDLCSSCICSTRIRYNFIDFICYSIYLYAQSSNNLSNLFHNFFFKYLRRTQHIIIFAFTFSNNTNLFESLKSLKTFFNLNLRKTIQKISYTYNTLRCIVGFALGTYFISWHKTKIKIYLTNERIELNKNYNKTWF